MLCPYRWAVTSGRVAGLVGRTARRPMSGHRRSVRLASADYAAPGLHPGRRSVRIGPHRYDGGLYFVTICTASRVPLLGAAQDGGVDLSVAGRLARDLWLGTGAHQPRLVYDAFVVMPDHVHLLFGVVPPDGTGDDLPDHDDGGRRGTACCAPTDRGRPGVGPAPSGRPFGFVAPGTVPAIVRGYKSAVTHAVRASARAPDLAVWQRGYHDRVVRTDREAGHVRAYIEANPARAR